MLEEAIRKIQQLTIEGVTPHIIRFHEVDHLVQGTTALPMKRPIPSPLEVRTLQAVIDYLDDNRDGLTLETLTVIVGGPGCVEVVGPARVDGARVVHLRAKEPEVAGGFAQFINRFMSVEDFVIGAQQRFRPGMGDIAQLLAVVGNITQNDVRTVADDGVSQEVTARLGVVKVQQVALPSPCLLVPRRGFPEIELSAVPYVVRVRRGDVLPQVAIFEADGGAWMSDATGRTADWLTAAWVKGHQGVLVPPFGVMA